MMNLLLSSEAEAAGQAMASPIVWVIYFAVLIGIFYFLFYRPQKKEQKKRSWNGLRLSTLQVTINSIHWMWRVLEDIIIKHYSVGTQTSRNIKMK